MRQKKTLMALAAVLIVLAALTWLLRSCNAKEEQRRQEEQQNLADTRVLETEEDQTYSAISYDNGQVNLSFARDEADKWYWVDDPDFPLNGYYLDRISQLVIDLHPMQTITEGDTMEAYGLEEPAASLKAAAAGGEETVLLFGKTTSDGSYYMKTSDSDTVYVVSDELRESMNKGIYDMAEIPDIPTFTGANLRSVRVESPAQDLTLSVEAEDGDEASWIFGDTDMTDHETVSALADELAGLRFTACVDYRPTDEAVALCGLGSPQVTITVYYVPDGGSETTFKMSVGNAAADGNGYYARMEGDTTIYSVAKDSVQALLSIAQSGLPA
ncbi:DUF4340 domain-containing protein [Oscillibacter sp. MSJ-2]|uniref:DUF4340 domain-containing protein n=1 Tax=Dysosmobacter acutus TaxID=2841504 RepID=A0ABS6F618_9FIRM|nr:DUF4340 domain-containing protein [Dysosmobacter acutus]MBU5625602.1 DUF4340 domain-containing protein [Dysosmobacter acutus]